MGDDTASRCPVSSGINTIDGSEIPLQAFLGNYEPGMFRRIRNEIYSRKPRGGLWTSTFNEEIGSEWILFCAREYMEGVAEKGIPTITKIRAKKGKCFSLVDSYDDLVSIINEYQAKYSIDSKLIDFEELAKKYEGIYLTRRGQQETKRMMTMCSLIGWDVETVLFFKPDSFEVIEKIKCQEDWMDWTFKEY